MKNKLLLFAMLNLCCVLANDGRAEKEVNNDSQPFVNSLSMRMMPIPAGAFEMGAGWVGPWEEYHQRVADAVRAIDDPVAWKGGEVDESPPHRVTISRPFFMASCEVTNRQYEMFDPDHRKLRTERNPGDDDAVGDVLLERLAVLLHDVVERVALVRAG